MTADVTMDVRELRQPKREHAFLVSMRRAYDAARQSPDSHTQNGAVVIEYNPDDPYTFALIGKGHNPTPPQFDDTRYQQEAYKTEGVHHAEVDALLECAATTGRARYATMVCPWASCLPCARAIVRAGVIRLVRHRDLMGWSEAERAKNGNPSYVQSIEMGDAYLREHHVEIVEIRGKLDTHLPIRHSGGVFGP